MERYIRQIPLLGRSGQARLRKSSVGIIGLGGLGSIISMYLAGAGVGKLLLVDFDTVSLTDLHRQLLYTIDDIGKPKALVGMKRLAEINSEVHVDAVNDAITSEEKADEVAREVDIIALAVDNWKTRQLINASAIRRGKPISHGAVNGWIGTVTTIYPGKTPCLRELSSLGAGAGDNISCLAGDCSSIIGPVAGVIASIQSSEVIRIAAGLSPVLMNKLLIIDLGNGIIDEVQLQRSPTCPVCGGL